MTNAILGFLNTIRLKMVHRISFDESMVGRTIVMNDGKRFTVFRRVVIKSFKKPAPAAYFLVRFKPLDMTPEQNIKFSKKPMMIFMGFSGFRSKYWAVDYETGLCQGLYEWQTLYDAEKYSKSIAMRFMSNRSDPSSVSFRIIDKSKEQFNFVIE